MKSLLKILLLVGALSLSQGVTPAQSAECAANEAVTVVVKEMVDAGAIVGTYDGARFKAIMEVLEKTFGPAPFEADSIVVNYVNKEQVVIGFVKDNCFVKVINPYPRDVWEEMVKRSSKEAGLTKSSG